MSVILQIKNLESDIAKYEILKTADNLVDLLSSVINTDVVNAGDSASLVKLNALMGECLVAMQNKDYLLLADILEYRLKPMIGE
jgi:hypothetical protein